jgi:hypothetical protein
MSSSIRTVCTLALTTTLALLTFGLEVSSGVCAPPTIELELADQLRVEVDAGQALEIVGRDWTLDCSEEESVDSCGRIQPPPPQHPLEDISIVLRRGSDPGSKEPQTLILAEGVRADRSLEFRITVELPEDLDEGGWSLFARSGGFSTGAYLLIVR